MTMPKRRKKKGRIGKFFLFVFILGVLISFFILFQKEILHTLQPFLERFDLAKERREVVLYFSDRDGDYLIGEQRKIEKRKEAKEEIKTVIEELIKGPQKGLIPTLPPRTKCLNVQLDPKGRAIVNFNKSLAKDHPGGSSGELLTVYSIVNSLTRNFSQIKEVQILIDGKPVETIAGHLSLRQPLTSKSDLVKK